MAILAEINLVGNQVLLSDEGLGPNDVSTWRRGGLFEVREHGRSVVYSVASWVAVEEVSPMGLLASTTLYGFPNTKTFEVRQIIFSKSTNVRIRSLNFHKSKCWIKFQVSPQVQNGSRR